jgi:hypothetical protein
MMSAMSDRIGPARQYVVEAEIGDEISLYDTTSERVLVLNATASDVWRLADGEYTIDQLVEVLARAYGIDAGSIRDDVVAVVNMFQEEGLLEGGEE